MGRESIIRITYHLYSLKDTDVQPGYDLYGYDIYIIEKFNRLIRDVVSILKRMYHDDIKVVKYSELHILLYTPQAQFEFNIDNVLESPLENDIEFLMCNPQYYTWLIHHISVDNVPFRCSTDCIDYLQYLLSNNLTEPGLDYINKYFRHSEKSELQSYKQAIDVRKKMVKEGYLDSKYLYCYIPKISKS